MDKWFTEAWTDNVRFSLKVKETLCETTTRYQKLAIYESYEVGRFFALDDVIMLTEKDEFIYHEMMIHVPMSVNPRIKKVLVIGGGDGGSVRELTRYPRIEAIEMVEIDEAVVRACQKYLPFTAGKLDDGRVRLIFGDGLAYVKESRDCYDLIVVDSTDPIGPGEGLFTKEFYQNCFRLLGDDGILVNQHESPYFANNQKQMQRAHAKLKAIFPFATVYQAFIPTYPSGHWLFGFASKLLHPLDDHQPGRLGALGITTRYYNDAIHKAAFVLPNYVQELLNQ